MPITFPDGTRMELLYPPELNLADLGVNPSTYGAIRETVCGGNLLIRAFDARGEIYRGNEPIAVFETTSGGRAELWGVGEDDWPSYWVVFQFGNWQVLVWCPVAQERAREGAELWASSLEGEETSDGYLVLTGLPPLTLADKNDSPGPELYIEGGPNDTLLVLAPTAHCVGAQPEADRIEWCIEGNTVALTVTAHGPDRDFVNSVMDGLRVRAPSGQ